MQVRDPASLARQILASVDARPSGLLMPMRRDFQDFVDGVAFSPDGKTFATGGGGKVIIWDAAPQSTRVDRKLLTLQGHTDIVWGVAFHRSGKRLPLEVSISGIAAAQAGSAQYQTSGITRIALRVEGRQRRQARRQNHCGAPHDPFPWVHSRDGGLVQEVAEGAGAGCDQ